MRLLLLSTGTGTPHTVHRRCLLAAALLGCCCELLRTHEHLLLAVLLGWLFGLVE